MPFDDFGLEALTLPTLTRVRKRKEEPYESDPERRRSLLGRLGDTALSGLSMVGNVLDVPGSMVRDTLAGENPFDQLLSPHTDANRKTGRDLLRTYGMAGKKDTWGNWGAGLAAEVLLDPTTYLSAGATALTKGGKLAKMAGLADDAAKVAARRSGVELSKMGARQARVSTTLKELLDEGGQEALEKVTTAADKSGIKLTDDVLNDKLGGLMGIGLPFMDPFAVIGKGSEKTAKFMDDAGKAIQFAKIPGTDFAPVNSARKLFDASIQGADTPEVQAAAKQLTKLRDTNMANVGMETQLNRRQLEDVGLGTHGEHQKVREMLEDHTVGPLLSPEAEKLRSQFAADPLHQANPAQYASTAQPIVDAMLQGGKINQNDAHVLSKLLPLPGLENTLGKPKNDIVGSIRKDLKQSITENREWGVNDKEYLDPDAAYAPRHMTEGLAFSGKKTGRTFGTDDANDIKRQFHLFGVKNPANTFTEIGKDAQLNDLIDNGATLTDVRNYLEQTHGGKMSPTYREPGGTQDLDRFEKLAEWYSGMPKELRQAGVFGNHPIADLAKQRIAAKDTGSAARVVLETLSQPGILRPSTSAARNEGMVKVKEVLKTLKMFAGDEAEGALVKLYKINDPQGYATLMAKDPDMVKAVAKNFGEQMIPEKLANDLTKMVDKFTSPESVSEVLKAVDTISNLTKASLTGPWPAFHMRNLFDSVMTNVLGGMWNPSSNYKADQLMRKGVFEGASKIQALQKLAKRYGYVVEGKGRAEIKNMLMAQGGLADAEADAVSQVWMRWAEGYLGEDALEAINKRVGFQRGGQIDPNALPQELDPVTKEMDRLSSMDNLTPDEAQRLRDHVKKQGRWHGTPPKPSAQAQSPLRATFDPETQGKAYDILSKNPKMIPAFLADSMRKEGIDLTPREAEDLRASVLDQLALEREQAALGTQTRAEQTASRTRYSKLRSERQKLYEEIRNDPLHGEMPGDAPELMRKPRDAGLAETTEIVPDSPFLTQAKELLKRIPGLSATGLAIQLGDKVTVEQAKDLLQAARKATGVTAERWKGAGPRTLYQGIGDVPHGWTDEMSDEFEKLESLADEGELQPFEQATLDRLRDVWEGKKAWNSKTWMKKGGTHLVVDAVKDLRAPHEVHTVMQGGGGKHYEVGAGFQAIKFDTIEEAKRYVEATQNGYAVFKIGTADGSTEFLVMAHEGGFRQAFASMEDALKTVENITKRQLPDTHPAMKGAKTAFTVLRDLQAGMYSVEEATDLLKKNGIGFPVTSLENVQSGASSIEETMRSFLPADDQLRAYAKSVPQFGDFVKGAMENEFGAPPEWDQFAQGTADNLSKTLNANPAIYDDVIDEVLRLKKEAKGIGPRAIDEELYELAKKVEDAVDGADTDDEFIQQLQAKLKGGDTLQQRGGNQAKGAVTFGQDGKALIQTFQSADVSTHLHEFSHVARRHLTPADQDIANAFVGAAKGAAWTVPQEEKFARGFENYIRTGQAPSSGLKALFDRLKAWMTGIYQSIVGSPIDVQLTPEIKELYGRLIGTPVAAKKVWDDKAASKILGDLAYAFKVVGKGELDNVIGNLPGEPATIEGIKAGSPGEVPYNFADVGLKFMGRKGGATWNPLKAKVRGVGDAAENTFAPMAAGDHLSHYIEGQARLAPFIKLLEDGVDPAEAAMRIGAAQVRYQNKYYTKFEQEAMGRLFPFYKFTRQKLPYVMKQLMERPGGAYGQSIRAANRARNPDEFTPDYVGETASIPLGKSADGGSRFLTGLGLSMEDPLSLIGGPRSMGLEVLSRLNPMLKGPLEYATGETFFQKGPEGGRNLTDMDPTVGRLISNVTGQKQATRIPFGQEIDVLLNNSPASRVLSTARVLTDSRKGPLAKAANLGTGFKVTDVSPGAQDAVLRERAQALEKKLGGHEFIRMHFPEEERERMSPMQLQLVDELMALDRELALRAKARKAEREKAKK